MMARRWWATVGCTTLITAGCAGGPPPASADAKTTPLPATEETATEETSAPASAEPDRGESQASPAATGEAPTTAPMATEPPPPLEVRYHVSTEGLRVTVSDIEFVPRATPVRVGRGWGVRIDVAARARDHQPHVLFTPDQGPLAFFAIVDRGDRKEEHGDERRGQGEEFVTEDGIQFSRTWPGDTGQAPLLAGQQLELQVGLWGVGESMLRHRPLKGFFTVKMVGGTDGAEPQASLHPPSTAR